MARRSAGLGLLLFALTACGGGSTEPGPTSIGMDPVRWLLVGAGETVSLEATLLDAGGDELSGTTFQWESGDPSVATVNSAGVVTAVAAGTTQIRARSESLTGTATVEVYEPPSIGEWEVGTTYQGRESYVLYSVGSLPIVISAGHGGALEPSEIPDRTYGTTVRDTRTAELAEAIADAIEDRMGERPHLVVNALRRTKLDPNREIVEAAQGSPFAEQAWAEYHGFIDQAKALVTESLAGARGLYLDIHGHGHEIQRLELGYLLSSSDLGLDDPVLDGPGLVAKSSVRGLVGSGSPTLSELVRGPASVGSLLAERGVRAVPSGDEPSPGGAPYFTGGYSTVRHGSRDGGAIDGIQIEHHFGGIRDTAPNRGAYAAVLAEVVELFMAAHDMSPSQGELAPQLPSASIR